MTAKVGCDMHKEYSLFSMIDDDGVIRETTRVEHTNGQLMEYLEDLPDGSQVAVEACGGWYRVIDEMEEAGLDPKLTDPHRAKLMMGNVDKTDKLDAQGLAKLLATGTLPEVWIPSKEVRDGRELLRCRMKLVGLRTSLKNRIHASLAKYGVRIQASDLFGNKESQRMKDRLEELPEHHRFAVVQQRDLVDRLTQSVDELTDQIQQMLKPSSDQTRLKTIPGVGDILSAVILLEVGDVTRFPGGGHLASYAGTVPRVHASGGRVTHGETKKNVNHYLKWAYAEAANTISMYADAWDNKHVARKYNELKQRRNHGVAIGAVSRHLAEATWHILSKEEAYRDPVMN